MQIGSNNRQKSLILAAQIQERLKSKVLKQIDKKTWVYCDSEDIPVNPKYKPEVITASEGPKWAKKVNVNGIIYQSVRAYCQASGKAYGFVYKMLRGETPNTLNVKYTF